jgi:very-short-patch-repair endonuclease
LGLIPKDERNKAESKISGLTTGQLRWRLQEAESKHRSARTDIDLAIEGEPLPERLEKLCREGKALLPTLVDALHACSEEDARHLLDLRGNLGLVGGKEALRSLWKENAGLILRHFPLWACSTLAVAGRIPLAPGLFDYLIVDEATTSDLASALPLFARAKHAIVVGDRQQTGMISDLNPAREAQLRRRAGLTHTELGRYTFSQISLFDLAWSSPAAHRHMLRDHFRCHAEIAAYCSETFYDGRLFIRTDDSSLRPPKGQRPGLHWTHVTGPIEHAGKGCRSHAEATALVDHLVTLVEQGGYDGTVGVVTPFNRQSELLVHMIEQRLPRDMIDKVQLRVGTSHKFQGDDRDVVLVSLCYGRDMPRNGDWFLRKSRELMNVAISRARAVCHVFGDREAARTSDIRHIARLAAKISAEGAPDKDHRTLFDSPWEERLYDALCSAGLDPLPQYRLGGRRLDLALIENNVKLDVEVDGDTYHRDPDGFRKISDIWRDHVVTSLGWRVRRFWVYELREDMERCVELVLGDLGH